MTFDPNPLFYWMLKKYAEWESDDKLVICNEGGSRCFDKYQKVITNKGSKRISDVKKSDYVLTFNEKTKCKEYKKVNRVFKFNNKKKCLEITLKNGNVIRCTEDHEFYHKGKWTKIKEIIRLIDYGKMENNRQF